MTKKTRQIRARVTAQLERESNQRAERQRGLDFARAWRERNRPIFDALYGPEVCSCGSNRP